MKGLSKIRTEMKIELETGLRRCFKVGENI